MSGYSNRMRAYLAHVTHDDGTVVPHIIRGSAASSAVLNFIRLGLPATAIRVQAGVLQAGNVFEAFHTKELR